MDNGTKRAVLNWHRRSGKDKTAWNYLIRRAVEQKGVYFYILPTYRQAKQVIWDGIDKEGVKFLDHIPQEITASKNESEMTVELVNGSTIQLVGSENIDRIVGTNPIGCVLSEYSLMKANVWDYIRPILAENGGWAVFIFTPRGMNHGWKILQQAKENENWFWQILTVDDTQAIAKERLEDEKTEMPEDLYLQEYYCKYLEGAGQFFRKVDEVTYDGKLMVDKQKRYQMGVDLAKYQDFTVLTSVDLHNFHVLPQERFNQMDWKTQEASIEAFLRRHNNGQTYVDATGVGDPVCEALTQKGLKVEPFVFTERARRDLLNNLRIMMEQGKIRIPNDEGLINELRSVQYSLSDTGKVKVTTPEGMHDDRVMSLALAVWNLGEPYPAPKSGMVSRLLETDQDSYVGYDAE